MSSPTLYEEIDIENSVAVLNVTVDIRRSTKVTESSIDDYIEKIEINTFSKIGDIPAHEISFDSKGSQVVKDTKSSFLKLKPCFGDLEPKVSHTYQQNTEKFLDKFLCSICSQKSTGFCIGCLDKRYCKLCHTEAHQTNLSGHLYCPYIQRIKDSAENIN